MTAISDTHVRAVCKIGQGASCCRYLNTDVEPGFVCLKGDPVVAPLIDERVAAGAYSAHGDNCDGWDSGVAA